MKQMRGLLVAAIALAVLSGLVYWSKKHKADEAAKPPADAPPKILTLDDKQVNEVTIHKLNTDPVVLTKLAGKWEITKPEPMPADQDAVKSLVSAASTLTSDHLIDDKPTNLEAFGLKIPVTELTLNLDKGKSRTLDIGNDTPAGGATYVKLADDPRVFTIASFSKTSLDKSLNDLRDKRLVTFDSDKLSRVELTAKGPAVEFGKNGQNEWQILKPEPARADALLVDDLVRKLKDAKAQVEAGKIAPSTFAAAPKIATISFTDNGGTQTVEIRQDKDKNTYAKSSVVDGIYKVGPDLAEAMNKSFPDFRTKKLFDFGFTELSQITANSTTYSHAGEKWFSNGKEMDGSSIQTLIDKLRDLTATGFAAKAAGTPIFTAGIVTQDKKRTEKVIISRDGTNTIAVRDGEPGIYTLENSMADDLIKAANDVKTAAKPAATKAPAKK